MIRSRGRGGSKRYWGVEMNKAWQFYLKMYGVINTIDQVQSDKKEAWSSKHFIQFVVTSQ
eukprot:1220939-Ditylum_brightwellii.AAC.1